jgi:nucleolar MIF4G domain-containing protein 1
VLLLRQKIGEAGGEAKLGVRTRFMIDTINDLKNNRLGRKHALANASSSSSSSSLRAELLTRMRKTLGTLSARKLQSTEPLRFSLAAVRNSDKRGSWWLPGRAAATSVGTGAGAGPEKHARAHQPPHNGRGDALGGSDGDYNANDEDNDDEELAEGALGTASLLQLAKQQRMNTDVRRAIFVALMSASDCRDAQFRLAKLRLKRAQEAEIPRVLMQCAGAEPAYNPYYTLVAQKLLLAGGAGQRRLHMAFQFALWNVFRAMGDGGGDEDDDYDDGYRDDDDDDEEGQGVDGRTEGAMGMRKIVNLAKMYGALVAARALSLGVLKVC